VSLAVKNRRYSYSGRFLWVRVTNRIKVLSDDSDYVKYSEDHRSRVAFESCDFLFLEIYVGNIFEMIWPREVVRI